MYVNKHFSHLNVGGFNQLICQGNFRSRPFHSVMSDKPGKKDICSKSIFVSGNINFASF